MHVSAMWGYVIGAAKPAEPLNHPSPGHQPAAQIRVTTFERRARSKLIVDGHHRHDAAMRHEHEGPNALHKWDSVDGPMGGSSAPAKQSCLTQEWR